MNTPTMTPRSPDETPGHRRLTVAGIAATFVIAAGAVIWYLGQKPPTPDADVADVAGYVADEKFRELPADQRRQYVDRLRQDVGGAFESVGPEQRRQLGRNLFGTVIEERMTAFQRATTKAERNEILDEAIDGFRQRMAERDRRAATRPDGGGRGEGGEGRGFGGGGRDANPAQRAQRVEFFAALRNRAEERGIDMPDRGGFGGGGPSR